MVLFISLWAGVLLTTSIACEGECKGEFLQVALDVQRGQAHGQAHAYAHHWPHARGKPPQFGTTAEVWANQSVRWMWHDPAGRFHNLLSGGVVIDEDSNMFLMSAKGLYAFSVNGQQLWHYETPGISNNEPSLFEDLVLGSTKDGVAFGVNRVTGEVRWETKLAESAGGDCGYPAAFDGIMVVGALKNLIPIDGGNRKVFGLNAHTGEKLWEYQLDVPTWNLTPLFPGDGSVLFQDWTGSLLRLGLHSGALIWRSPARNSSASFSDGGAILGPNQMAYTCSNYFNSMGTEGNGVVRAYELSSGRMVWEHITPDPCNSYPSVGHLQGIDRLAVVVTPGRFVGAPAMKGSVLALDAETGSTFWEYHAAPYTGLHFQAAGDMEGFDIRSGEGIQELCLPAHWSAPVIDGAGTVLVGRLDGKLYHIVSPDQAEVREFGAAPLHGAVAAAPGLFTFTTCDTLYVF